MKIIRFFGFMLTAVVMSFAMTACGGDSDDDNGGGSSGGGGNTSEWESRLTSVIPAKYLNELKGYITIYEGDTPPNIEGLFLMKPLSLVKDSYDATIAGQAPMYFEFSDQNPSKNTIRLRQEQNHATGSAYGAYICGSGSNFTVFLDISGKDGNYWWKIGTILSGTMTSNGIQNLRYAFVMLDNNDPKEEKIMKPGRWRVWKDGDGMSEFTSWP